MSNEQWVRLPISALSMMLEQRFGRLEKETRQLREELTRTQDALDQVKTGLMTIQSDQQLTANELRAELGKLTGAIGALTSGNVTVRTREVQYSPKNPSGVRQETPPPSGWVNSARPQVPAARAVVESMPAAPTAPSRPRPAAQQPAPARPVYRKPVYDAASGMAQARPQPARSGHNMPASSAPDDRIPESARVVRGMADRVLKALGVDPPKS